MVRILIAGRCVLLVPSAVTVSEIDHMVGHRKWTADYR